MSTSIYKPLSDSPQSIRVIRIAPSNNFGKDRVVCQLNETKWDSCQYEALSYCWGGEGDEDGEDNMTDILLNGESWQVTEHLYEGLRKLCMPDRIRTLWIDALCINQQDQDEKSVQVQKMGDIYRYAQRVVVWLGSDRSATEVAFKHVSELAHLTSDDDMRSIWEEGGQWIYHLNKLILRKYWYRAWTVQEVVLAQDAVLYCGPFTVPFFDLARLLIHPVTRQYLNVQYHLYSYLKQVFQLRETQKNPPLGLFSLAYSFRLRQCSVPHDKVYAFMGLLNRNPTANPETLHVDYIQDIGDLVLSLSKDTMKRYRTLVPLALADEAFQFTFGPQGLSPQVKWCWDFSDTNVTTDPKEEMYRARLFWSGGLEDPYYHPLQSQKWSASAGLPARLRTELDIDTVVAAQGFRIGKVVAVGPSVPLYRTNVFGRPNYRKLFETWEAAVGGPWANEDMTRKFASTVTGGAWTEEPMDWREWNKKNFSEKWYDPRWLLLRIPFQYEDVSGFTEGYVPSRHDWEPEGTSETARRYDIVRDDACEGRRIFLMDNGHFGLGRDTVAVGDQAVVLLGCEVPLVLHERNWTTGWHRLVDIGTGKAKLCKSTWKNLGQAYVHDFMRYDGNLEQDIAEGKVVLEEFLLD